MFLNKIFGRRKKEPITPVDEVKPTCEPNVDETSVLLIKGDTPKEAIEWFDKRCAEISNDTASTELPDVCQEYEEYNRLTYIGFKNTPRTKALKKTIDDYYSLWKPVNQAKKNLNYLKDIKELYGEKTLVVPRDAFIAICNKFGLTVTLASKYDAGQIPSEKIDELYDIVEKDNNVYDCHKRLKIKAVNDGVRCSTNSGYKDILILDTSIRLYASRGFTERDKDFDELVKKNCGLMKLNRSALSYSKPQYHLNDIVGLNKHLYGSHYFTCDEIEETTLMIAYPSEKSRVSDHIVFKMAPDRVIIHTMWDSRQIEDESKTQNE